MTQIEKIARLMGYSIVERKPDFNYYQIGVDTVGTFDPLTNKSDLMELECEIGIDVQWSVHRVYAGFEPNDEMTPISETSYISHFSDKFTARAHAVCALAEQIYDNRTEGK